MGTENKTKPTAIAVTDFLSTVSETRQNESSVLITMMQKISGEKPVMWGPSIIGFGTQHYKSEAGREGEIPVIAFSPRKASLTIYFYEGFDRYGAELAKLGKHTQSQSCLYIPKLEHVDQSILETMIKSSYALTAKTKPNTVTVDTYIQNVPQAARPLFDELRALVKTELPQAKEVVSYGIIGYKIDDKRARVFISGWKDHLGVYPIPHDDVLREELGPYIKSKGTLWFPLGKPLPVALIRKTVQFLTQ